MLPSRPDECSQGILRRDAFELFLQRYDLLSELVARLEPRGAAQQRARSAGSLAGALWAILSGRGGSNRPTAIDEEEEELEVSNANRGGTSQKEADAW